MNLINGKIVSDTDDFKKIFNAQSTWHQGPLSIDALFMALEKIRFKLLNKDDLYQNLVNDLKSRGDLTSSEIEISMKGLIDFINIDQLRLKLKREFNSENPFELKRITMREMNFEAWYPRGVLLHVLPNNSPLLSVLGIIEGLLSSNVNVLKLGRKEGQFSIIFYSSLLEADFTNTLKNYIIIGRISSRDIDFLKGFFKIADVVSAWGSEESLKAIKEQVTPGTKIIEWGHKISFSYFTKDCCENTDFLNKLAFEICNLEQQACSSPQCVFIEDASFEDLESFAQKLSLSLNKISPLTLQIHPNQIEQAEITVVQEQVRLESCFGNARLIEAHDQSWRILIDMNEGLAASPLFRTIWIKPIKKNDIVKTFRPLRQYLQTVGLAVSKNEIEGLINLFFESGVQRIRTIGEMTSSYTGEPHDGVHALREFCQRITYSDSGLMDGRSSLDLLKKNSINDTNPIMTKKDFQNMKVQDQYSDLFFHSGGSSGEPKLSIFTYDDYHRQMEVAAEGLYAAGLDPATDRCMNLFYAGNLYGGFVSFFTILEKMEAVQFPMGATTEFEMAANTIVKNRVDTLLGMPSYIMQLFTKNKNLFKSYSGVKKIFYGGEHMSHAQKEYLKNEFGVISIRSASYGSVDAGPLGYQCTYCEGSIHHLHEKLHRIEVVSLENDHPVKEGEIGRFLFTSLVRHGQSIRRYEIGDVGKIISNNCECGRKGIRFELLGRHGDVFRIGTIFLSYQKFHKILMDIYEFEGSFQIHLRPSEINGREKVEIYIEDIVKENSEKNIRQNIIENYPDLIEVVVKDLVLEFEVAIKKRSDLSFNQTTGKLRSVIDHRIKG